MNKDDKKVSLPIQIILKNSQGEVVCCPMLEYFVGIDIDKTPVGTGVLIYFNNTSYLTKCLGLFRDSAEAYAFAEKTTADVNMQIEKVFKSIYGENNEGYFLADLAAKL